MTNHTHKHLMNYTFRRRKEIEETIILHSFGYSSFCASSFMFLNLFDDLHGNVLSLFPINSAPEIVILHHPTHMYKSATLSLIDRLGICVSYTYPLHLMISGPSNPNGSSLSGSDLITYSFVNNVLVKKSFGSK